MRLQFWISDVTVDKENNVTDIKTSDQYLLDVEKDFLEQITKDQLLDIAKLEEADIKYSEGIGYRMFHFYSKNNGTYIKKLTIDFV